jgi:hypothetical protein
MRILKNFQLALVLGSCLLVLVGLCLIPSWGLAREEISVGGWVVQGDPCDGLGSGGGEGEPEDGLGIFLTGETGDPTDGIDFPFEISFGDPGDGMDWEYGDPGDGLEHNFQGDPGDAVLELEIKLFFGIFWVP